MHHEFYDQPIRLKNEKPIEAIKSFFSAYKLHEIRRHLWEMVETCVTTDNHYFEESHDRDSLIWFYGQIEELIEAAYLVNQKKAKKKLKRKK